MSTAPFRLGDHLQVFRWLYYHHGIYVGDGRVVQFGGSPWDKPHAKIEEVFLEKFAKGGTAKVVNHARLSWLHLGPLPAAFPPERIVARARCLVKAQPQGVYNLIGRNCETVALWCVCGMGESLQRQTAQIVNLFFGVAVEFYFAWVYRHQGKSLTSRQLRTRLLLGPVRTILTLVPYYLHNWRFYRDARACEHL